MLSRSKRRIAPRAILHELEIRLAQHEEVVTAFRQAGEFRIRPTKHRLRVKQRRERGRVAHQPCIRSFRGALLPVDLHPRNLQQVSFGKLSTLRLPQFAPVFGDVHSSKSLRQCDRKRALPGRLPAQDAQPPNKGRIDAWREKAAVRVDICPQLSATARSAIV